jgi:hypothetical protein
MGRLRADDGHSGGDKFPELPHQLRRRALQRSRQHQHPIAPGTRQGYLAPLRGGAREQHVGVHQVKIVASRQHRHRHLRRVRRTLANEIEDVRRVVPLPQHPLAARQVVEPRFAPLEPRVRAVEVKTPGTHRHPGRCGGMRLMREPVKQHLIQPEAEHLVAQDLQRVRGLLPAGRLLFARERLAGDHRLSVGMRRRGHHFHRPVRGPRRALPKFRHRKIGQAADVQLVEDALSVAFDIQLQAMLTDRVPASFHSSSRP